MGELGLTPFDLYNMTLSEFNNAIQGHRNLIDLQARNQWESARFVAFFAILGHTKKGKLNKPTDLTKFPWEVIENNAPTAHEINESRDRVIRLLKKKSAAKNRAHQQSKT